MTCEVVAEVWASHSNEKLQKISDSLLQSAGQTENSEDKQKRERNMV